jgi:hypothetical protein
MLARQSHLSDRSPANHCHFAKCYRDADLHAAKHLDQHFLKADHGAFLLFVNIHNDEDFDSLSQRIVKSGAKIFKDNTSPGESLYFLDSDDHKIEIHVGNCQDRIRAKKENQGNWKNVEWFV